MPAPDPTRPDIILVSIDSLRADHLGSYGNPRQPSPLLDELASSGLRFARGRSASPWTLPSHTTMLSGQWPTDHGVVEDTVSVPAELPWIPDTLRAAGWSTSAVVSTVYVSRTFGFARGFDHFEDFALTVDANLDRTVRATQIVDTALAAAREAPHGKPIFLFLHFYDVHYPYLPPEPYNTRYDKAGTRKSTAYRTYGHYVENPVGQGRMEHLRAQYDESIAYVDAELRRLRDAWGRPATWIVTADHGEEFGERGSWGHAHTLYPEVLDVPFIVSGPGVGPAVRQEYAGTIDVAATIAAVAGLPWSGPGVDVRQPVPERTHLMETSRFDTTRLGVLVGERRFDLDLARGKRAVFDRAADPDERAPVGDSDAALETTLFRALPERWVQSGAVRTKGWTYREGALDPAPTGRFGVVPADAMVEGASSDVVMPQAQVDAATRARLEALGYQQ